MSAYGQLGIVTSPHPLATKAGAKVLRSGGNAIEAAIAIGATIGVVYPHFCGLGGAAVWLVADREGRRATFLGIGQAAKALPAIDGAIPTRGPLSMLTTACAVDSWRHALEWSTREWGGHASFPDLLADAIAHARETAFWPPSRKRFGSPFAAAKPRFGRASRRPSCPTGRPRSEVFSGRTASHKRSRLSPPTVPGVFTTGSFQRRSQAELAAAGSPLTAADLAATRTREATPLSLSYRGYELLAPPPPTQGVSTLAIMGILEHFNLSTAWRREAPITSTYAWRR